MGSIIKAILNLLAKIIVISNKPIPIATVNSVFCTSDLYSESGAAISMVSAEAFKRDDSSKDLKILSLRTIEKIRTATKATMIITFIIAIR